MRPTTRIMLLVTTALLASLVVAEVAYAWLGLSSYRLEVDLAFGTTTETTVQVRNLTDEPKLVQSSVCGVRVTPTGDLLWLGPNGEDPEGGIYRYGAVGPLVKIEPTNVVIPAESSAEFTIQIVAPEEYVDGAPAGRVGALQFTASPVSEDAQGSLLFRSSFRVVTFLLLQFTEYQHREAQLRETHIQQHGRGRLRFSALLENTGNVHLSPWGQIFIHDPVTEQTVAELDLSEGILLPGCQRTYSADWEYPQELSGTYEAAFHFTYEGEQETELVKKTIFEMSQGQLRDEVTNPG